MTGAGTISQLGYVVGHIRIFVLLMRSRLEITGVAAGAGGRVSAKTPGDGLRVGGVAVSTTQVPSVLPGVAGRAVPEYLGRPAGDSVTAAAIQAGLEVTVVLPGCGGAVVATLAITADAGVIEIGRLPGHRGVAYHAVLAGGNVIPALAPRSGPVVAALAVTGDAGMVEIGGAPGHRGMTDDTILGGGNVIATLALGGAAVMAVLAVAGDAGVAEIGR